MSRFKRHLYSYSVFLFVPLIAYSGNIAFSSRVDGVFNIYVLDTVRRTVRPLTANPFGAWGASVSRDGRFIAYVGAEQQVDQIYILDRSNGSTQRLIDVRATEPTWSPDGKWIAFVRGKGSGDLYRVRIGSRDLQKLSDGRGLDGNPSWSPDGREILFSSVRDGAENYDLYVMDSNGNNIRPFVRGAPPEKNPEWSPDGTLVLYESGFVHRDIYMKSAINGQVVAVTEHPSDDRMPSWSEDGRRVLFCSNRDGTRDIFVLNLEDGSIENLTAGTGYTYNLEPVWLPDFRPISSHFLMKAVWGWLKTFARGR